jgi:hypothetical protein
MVFLINNNNKSLTICSTNTSLVLTTRTAESDLAEKIQEAH